MELKKKKNEGFSGIGQIFAAKPKLKGTAHEWQDFALEVIRDLSIPAFKRGSVFKICKEKDRQFVMNCLNDTKELCKSGEKWKYFFKIAGAKKDKEEV